MRWQLLWAAVALTGCEGLFDGFDAGVPIQTEAAADVAGTWTIRGDGKLESCDDARLDTGDLKFESRALEVTQHTLPPAADGGVASEATLDLATPIPGAKLRNATVSGPRVRFEIVQTNDRDREVVVRKFDGKVNEIHQITGKFTGSGPGSCEAEGKFVVAIE